ncbi:hypothetical protein O0I10_000616 [Lichtheimia ornata]|uniref:Chromatin modification-related protein EAF7 n=1 Tax=Lichtheimia ornata TaxID=688661 RepID=A0AAD8DJ45_9FUNG|nr:uncharacterized protein O0I10_000616 [Lichtheimia ornata]KAJ8663377.1 hypothetical protein O0I10_000616 [Lichtheimia ornata]
MADVKNEDNSSIASGDLSDQQFDKSKDWNVGLELDFLNAVARCKPVGIHKHFRLISIQRQFNQKSHTPYSIQDIRDRLGAYYDMDALEELEQEEEEEEDVEGEADEENDLHEFTLPLDEYEQLISEHRQEEEAELSAPSPSPPPPSKKSRTHKRDASPMSSASATPTPEPEEGKSSRRSTRKKTDTRKRTSGTSKGTSSTGTGTASGSRRKRR